MDLEQREGRVHRYKGHAVRKNLAARWGDQVLVNGTLDDPWQSIFEVGRSWDSSDLEPFWICPGEAQIERHVPMLPLSREREQIKHLRRSLATYRMVFDQPRQDDLLSFLIQRVETADLEPLVTQLRIDLHPPKVVNTDES